MRDFNCEPITESITIHAPIERCFALSTRVELVKETLGMNLVGGVTSGFITSNSRVIWRGWKFGLPTSHHTLITGFSEPHEAQAKELNADRPGQVVAWFQDTQERGRFAFFQHDHYFRESLDHVTGRPTTELHDEVRFALPFGFLGRVAARALLGPYILKLARQRFQRIRSLAEGEGWREWVH